MNRKQRRIAKLPFPGIDGAYILTSFRIFEDGKVAKPVVSFFYDAGHAGAEWGPPHGPITLYHPCSKGDEGARPGAFYDYDTGTGDWSQGAADNSGFPHSAHAGNFSRIFEVLASFANGDR